MPDKTEYAAPAQPAGPLDETAALAAAKRALRAECRARLAAIPPEAWLHTGAEMAAYLTESAEWHAAKTVFCFVSLPCEPDTRPILRAALAQGKRLCVPRVLGGGKMECVVLPALSGLAPGIMNILEPEAALQTRLSPAEIDLALIPCLTAAENGARLGHGGGYYDRFLAGYRGAALLVCAEAMLTPAARIPTGAQDVPLARLLTENGPRDACAAKAGPAPGAALPEGGTL